MAAFALNDGFRRAVKVAGVLAAMGIASPGHAAVYKCTGPDGRTSYTDKPCTVYRDTAAPSQPDTPDTTASEAPDTAPATPSQPEPQASPVPGNASSAGADAQPSAEAQPPSAEEQARSEEEQQQAFEEELKRRFMAKAPLLALGALLLLAGWIMHVIAAAKLGKTAWAIALFLFCPFSNVPFTALNWQKAKAGFFVLLAGGVVLSGAYISIFAGMVR